MDAQNYESHYFHYARDHAGKLVPVGEVRRNGRLVPRFDPAITQPESGDHAEDAPDYRELVAEITAGLTQVERHTLLRLADGIPVLEIAREEGVRRQAIYCRIAAMIRKNPYCAIAAAYGVLRKKANQHK